MDKISVIKLLTAFLHAVPRDRFLLSKAYLFGSYAQDHPHDYSDIDLAIVIKNLKDPLSARIELMKLRRDFDLRIEPHPFRECDFNNQYPLVSEILKYGIEIPV
ncbi:MAG TPA: nucleotidyltransferase domain-containing protein [Bacteroidales bacterium]|nr:nucleotidyltransferase domain-containing protein [Bacteroidales bacterium]HSA42810.1 nucleotidyltransferase domain-containing protein [Bacteroidales bacterium]